MIAKPTACRLEALLPLLACPACGAGLEPMGHSLLCSRCAARYPIHEGRPVFLPGPDPAPRIVSPEHISNQPPDDILGWMTWLEGWILNLGAGGTRVKLENCVEAEYSIFRNTDVVTDAHHLPFGDEVFDAVVSFNTFEHLSDPAAASAEIFRVLKPGGRLFVHTAFLQPVHEPPHHYYNVTEYGLRRWFEAFEIGEVTVSDNFQPAHVLGWLASEVLQAVQASQGTAARKRLAASSLEEWCRGWEDARRRGGTLWKSLGQLPQDVQKRFAAGFQLDAIKPHPSHPAL